MNNIVILFTLIVVVCAICRVYIFVGIKRSETKTERPADDIGHCWSVDASTLACLERTS